MKKTESKLPRFATTHWSLVQGSGRDDPEAVQASLLRLCTSYWYPVHAYLRRSGHEPERAHELTRAFFHRVLSTDVSSSTASRFGRFRQFILAELHRFLAAAPDGQEAAHSRELDRPELAELEARLQAETGLEHSPESLLRRGFALEMLDHALAKLRREVCDSGRLTMFEALERFLGEEPQPGDYEASARLLKVQPLFVAMAVRRLRDRFRELVDEELSETLASPNELEAEREALMQALSGGAT